MNSIDYKQIREDNIKKYGTEVKNYGEILLSDLYSERTHFIYELIQNAEDACERDRARSKSAGKDYYIKFELHEDRLEVSNNGIPFDKNDVVGICSIAKGTKGDDPSQIGKFGIGFKSVFAYTRTPQIHSENTCFKIENYVHPYPIECKNKKDTVFVLPFNNQKVPPNVCIKEIADSLDRLSLRSLLFLKNIKYIYWYNRVKNTGVRYSKNEVVLNPDKHTDIDALRIEITKEIIDLDGTSVKGRQEVWIVLRKKIKLNLVINESSMQRKVDIDIAYLFDDNKNKVIPLSDNSSVIAYFPTKHYTGLKFLIQAPFNTTPSRETIKIHDEWNNKIIGEISKMLTQSLIAIKSLKLLDPSFLCALIPSLDDPEGINEGEGLFIFKPIFDSIINALKNGEFIPTVDKNFTSSTQAALPRGSELVYLITASMLKELFNKDRWVSIEITQDKMPQLWKFLKEVLNVREIESEDFARKLTKEFLEKQSDEWIDKFYKYIKGRKSLWQKSYWTPNPILLKKEIIRLIDGSHMCPFNNEGKIQVYLPPDDENMRKSLSQYFKFARIRNLSDESLEFLKALGLKVPDKVDAVIDVIIPKIEDKCRHRDNVVKNTISLISYIIQAWVDKKGHKREEEFMDDLKKAKIFYSKNLGTGKWDCCSLKDNILLSDKYLGESGRELTLFYEGNGDFWELDSSYIEELENENSNFYKILKKLSDKKKTTPRQLYIDFLVDIGFLREIPIWRRRPNWGNYVIIEDKRGHHIRGIEDFDSRATIYGLEHALGNITIEKSRIIWKLLSKNNTWKLIRGIIEEATRQDFYNAVKKERFSEFGKLLTEYSWIPDKDGKFRRPSELRYSDINPSVLEGIDEYISKEIAKKLGIKVLDYSQLEKAFEASGINDENKKEILKEFIEILPSLNDVEKLKSMISEIKSTLNSAEPEIDDYKENGQHIDNSAILDIWLDGLKKDGSIEPDETPPLLEGNDQPLNNSNPVNKGAIITRQHTMKEIKKDKFSEDIKEYLYSQYGGHCQVCNTRLDVGEKRPPFEILRIVEVRGEHDWANSKFNVLSLCPNCHTRMKVGGYDLTNIVKMAKKIKDGEYTAEYIPNRPVNLGYEIDVEIAGKPATVFFSKDHMEHIVKLKERNKEE